LPNEFYTWIDLNEKSKDGILRAIVVENIMLAYGYPEFTAQGILKRIVGGEVMDWNDFITYQKKKT